MDLFDSLLSPLPSGQHACSWLSRMRG
jgi:hypothetical protein